MPRISRSSLWAYTAANNAPRPVALAAGYEGLLVREIGTDDGTPVHRCAILVPEVAIICAIIEHRRRLTLGARVYRASQRLLGRLPQRGYEGKCEFVGIPPIARSSTPIQCRGRRRDEGVRPVIVGIRPSADARDAILHLHHHGRAIIGEYNCGGKGCVHRVRDANTASGETMMVLVGIVSRNRTLHAALGVYERGTSGTG